MVERSPLIHLAVSLFAAKDTTSRSPDGIVGPDNDLEPLVGWLSRRDRTTDIIVDWDFAGQGCVLACSACSLQTSW